MFMLKSRQGEALSARSDSARNDEMGLMAAVHNLMIVAMVELFCRARMSPFSTVPASGSARLRLAAKRVLISGFSAFRLGCSLDSPREMGRRWGFGDEEGFSPIVTFVRTW